MRAWVGFAILLLTLLYNILNTWAIRGNDLKHLADQLIKVEQRLTRIEELHMTK